MEQFDILDITGRPTGLVAEKGAALSCGQYYLGIHAYILSGESSFLIQRRALDKNFLPGGWDVHLGHVMAGESSADCAIREIREEIGLDVPPHTLQFAFRFLWEEYHHMVDVYFVDIEYAIENLKLREREVIDVRSISAGEMLNMVSAMDYRPAEYREFVASEITKRCFTKHEHF